MADKKDKAQAEAAVEQNPQAEEPKKKQKKEERKDEALRKQVAELTDNLAKEKDSYLRLMAEFETFRRRSAEDRLNLIASASAKTIEGLLPVLDSSRCWTTASARWRCCPSLPTKLPRKALR